MLARLFESITGIHLHRWGKWGDEYEVELNFYYIGIKQASCIERRQKRICETCRIAEEREVR